MSRRRMHVLGAVAVVLAIGLGVACSGDSEEDQSPPTASGPSVSPGPTVATNEEAIEAASAYLQETGIDDVKGTFTDPISCSQIRDDDESEFCVHETASVFAPGLTILIIGDREQPQDKAWEMRLLPGEAGWQVSAVTPYGTTE